MAKHEDLIDAHVPYRWTYADAAAREAATSFSSDDVGKLSRQLDDNSLWMLTATTPTWLPVMVVPAGGGEGQVLSKASADDFDVEWVNPGEGGAPDYILLQHQLPNGTVGGAADANTWTILPVNTKVSDTGGHCTLAANQFALAPGTYEVDIDSTFYGTDATAIRLRNITDSETTLLSRSNDGAVVTPRILGKFTIAAEKTFELQYICQSARASYGIGSPVGAGASNYTDVEIYRSLMFRLVG
jgi:hypothetical protein